MRQNIPALSMITMDEFVLRQRAQRLRDQLQEELWDEALIQSIEPVQVEIKWAVGRIPPRVTGICRRNLSEGDIVARVAGELRTGEPSVLTRIQDNRLVNQSPHIIAGDEELITDRLQQVIGGIRVE